MPAEPTSAASSYISAAIPPDSIEHYVVLMTPQEQRSVVASSIALAKVIDNISQQCQEPDIARLKLAWWLEEIEKIAAGKPRHPLSISISDLLDHQLWLAPLEAIVRGALSDLSRPVFDELTDLLPYCHQASERQALIASVLPHGDDVARTHARQIGVGICLTELLRDRHESNSRLPANASLSVAKLADIADEHFRAETAMPVEQRQAQLSVLLQARLHQRLLQKLVQRSFEPGDAPVHPLLQMWHAWREARNLLR